MERKYYLVTPGGKTDQVIQEWRRLNHEACEAGLALGQDLGATEVFRQGPRIGAFVFDKDPGRSWRKIRGEENQYMPHKGTKEGRAVAERIDAIKIPDSHSFAKMIGCGVIISGAQWGVPGFETLGDCCVISIPVGNSDISAPFVPPDTTLLKMSEYYALKEAAEESSRASQTAANAGASPA